MHFEHNKVTRRQQGPFNRKWFDGRKFYLDGIANRSELPYARQALGYYFWFGDRDYRVPAYPESMNDQARADLIMKVIDESPITLTAAERSAEQTQVEAACQWRRRVNKLLENSQKRSQQADKNAEQSLRLYVEQTGNVPSLRRLMRLAKCGQAVGQRALQKLLKVPSTVQPAQARPSRDSRARYPHDLRSCYSVPRTRTVLDQKKRDHEHRAGSKDRKQATCGVRSVSAQKLTNQERAEISTLRPKRDADLIAKYWTRIFELPIRGQITEWHLWELVNGRLTKGRRKVYCVRRCEHCGDGIVFLQTVHGRNIPVTFDSTRTLSEYDSRQHRHHYEDCPGLRSGRLTADAVPLSGTVPILSRRTNHA
jgi:hypothetical protein